MEPNNRGYTTPIACEGIEQFACILRNKSGEHAGEIDMRVRDVDHLPKCEQQDVVDMAYAIYKSYCFRTGLRATRDVEGCS